MAHLFFLLPYLTFRTRRAPEHPIVEALFHARIFLEMAVRCGRELEAPPQTLPSGWAAFLYLYRLR